MEENLKKQIDLLHQGEAPLQNHIDLLMRLASDPEARAYFSKISSYADSEIQKTIVENERSAYADALLDEYGDFIPASAYAADDGNNLCDFQCEAYLLKVFGKSFDDYSLSFESKNNYWLRKEGTPLFNIGKLLENNGLFVSRIYNGDLNILVETLKTCKVIAVVNGDLLLGKEIDIMSDDFDLNDCPNHAVVVESVSIHDDSATIYNPAVGEEPCVYSLAKFIEAWRDSKFYMLAVREKKHEFEYSPQPIDTSMVVLNKELLDLIELLSENAHDVWAKTKFENGYTYAPADDKTHNHFLKPYHMLTEKEKDQDRESVNATIKLLKRLGYRLININNMHRCPVCGEPIEPNHNFCPGCGRELSWEDFK